MEPLRGYAVYHGDNKKPDKSAFESDGNRQFMKLLSLYTDPKLRDLAPPILLFQQTALEGKRKGFRTFQGLALPVKVYLDSQKAKNVKEYFTNIVIELAIISLTKENGCFDWNWVDKRRNSRISCAESLTLAPEGWKEWVKKGNSVIERVRNRVTSRPVSSTSEQEVETGDQKLMEEVRQYYESNKHVFEGLAADITQKVLGEGFSKGCVTKRSGDGGIDFVGKYTLGLGFSALDLIVLGQAKCISPAESVSGLDAARLAARLQRGWIGVFVTTGKFSEACQKELYSDDYPILLINGKRLIKEIKGTLNRSGLSLREYLDECTAWYEKNISYLPPDRFADWGFLKEPIEENSIGQDSR